MSNIPVFSDTLLSTTSALNITQGQRTIVFTALSSGANIVRISTEDLANPGYVLTVKDETGTCNSNDFIQVECEGGGLIDGETTSIMSRPRDSRTFIVIQTGAPSSVIAVPSRSVGSTLGLTRNSNQIPATLDSNDPIQFSTSNNTSSSNVHWNATTRLFTFQTSYQYRIKAVFRVGRGGSAGDEILEIRAIKNGTSQLTSTQDSCLANANDLDFRYFDFEAIFLQNDTLGFEMTTTMGGGSPDIGLYARTSGTTNPIYNDLRAATINISNEA